MMLTRVQAQQIDGVWHLRTIYGNPIGSRMIASDEAPAIETQYETEGAARKAALKWNEYIMSMRKKKASKVRKKKASKVRKKKASKVRKSDGSDYVQDFRD